MNKGSLPRILAAMLYDGLILFGLLMGATALLIPFVPGHSIPPQTLSYQLYLCIVTYLYFDICWRKSGQTIGMQAWKLRLVSTQGPVSSRQTLIRFVGAILSASTLCLGYLWILLPAHQSWHDKLSKTQIIKI